jgi:prepilin-type N-terminal cleavage/methylation domain-containing protein
LKKYEGFTLTELIVVIAMGSVFFALVFHLINHSYEIFNSFDIKSLNYLEEVTINKTIDSFTCKVNKNKDYDLLIDSEEEVVYLKIIDSNNNLVEELIIYQDHLSYGDYEYYFKEYKLNIVYNPEFNKYFIIEYRKDESVVHREVFYIVRGIINEEK